MKNAIDKTSREYQLQQITGGRGALLSVLMLTVINLVMAVLDQGTYFLFSASIPYYLTLFCKGIENGFVEGAWPVTGPMTITALVISAVILAVYLVCWLLAKKRPGWITVAAVLFVLDTVALVLISFTLLESPVANLMDFLIHLWACWLLIRGARAAKKLKDMPQEEVRTSPELD